MLQLLSFSSLPTCMHVKPVAHSCTHNGKAFSDKTLQNYFFFKKEREKKSISSGFNIDGVLLGARINMIIIL